MIPFLLWCVQSEAVCPVPGMEFLSHQGTGCAAQVFASMLNTGGPWIATASCASSSVMLECCEFISEVVF